MRICKRCDKTEEQSPFSEKQKCYCKQCVRFFNRRWANARGIKEKIIPIVTDEGKQCCACLEIKPFACYSNCPRGRLGKSAYCKPCASQYQIKYLPKEVRKEKTQKYRDKNREWWRSLHRINQFNRKQKIKLLSDNTITPELVKEVYKRQICHYCKKQIPEKDRTLEHKQPLNRGGLHSASNITMACLMCNSTKRDMTETEFFNYINIQNVQS